MNDISENQDQYILVKLFTTVVSHLDFLAFAMSSTWRENRAEGTVSALCHHCCSSLCDYQFDIKNVFARSKQFGSQNTCF